MPCVMTYIMYFSIILYDLLNPGCEHNYNTEHEGSDTDFFFDSLHRFSNI